MNKQKYDTILETAERLFNRFGIRKTAVDEIAADARVAKGTIYNNFGSKEGVLRELLVKKAVDFENAVNRTFASIKDPMLRMKALLTERIKLLMETPFLSDSMLEMDENSQKFLTSELDKNLQTMMKKILDMDNIPLFSPEEKQRIIDTITFTLRGMEQSLRETVDRVNLQQMERDLDFLIGLIFPGKNMAQQNQ